MKRARRIALRLLAGVVALFVLVSVRVWVASSAEMKRAEASRAAGDTHEVITHLRRAARWYAPGNPYPRDALRRLLVIGREAEAADDAPTALRAYRGVRAATQAARSFYLPHADLAERADQAIARITARVGVPEIDIAHEPDEAARERAILDRLHDYEPPPGWLMFLALFAFGTFVVSTFLLAWRGIDEEDRFIKSEARRWGGLAGVSAIAAGVVMLLC